MVVLAIILAVGLVIILIRHQAKPTYFNDNSVKIIDFESSTGSVDPQYQASRSLIITPTSCTYIVTQVGSSTPQTANCQVTQANFDAIAAAYKSDGVQSKLASSSPNSNLIGGPTKTISVTTADGTQVKASVTPELKNQLNSWLQTVSQYVPQLNDLQY